MLHLHHLPSPPLDAYIDDLYYLDGPAPYRHLTTFPMPSLHLMVNLGHAFQVHASQSAESIATCTESWCIGLWSTSHLVTWPAHARFYGIHFKPGGAYPFLRLPLAELHNQVVPLDAIWGTFAAEVCERLAAALTVRAGFALLERLLLARLDAAPGQDIARHAVQEIARQRGALSIRGLSADLGISQNHLAALFKRLVGAPPKELARHYRMAHVLQAIDPAEPVDWARLAQESQFYDQAHFNKDFVAFTGYTPTTYLRLRRRLCAENPEQAQVLGQMPVA